MGDNVLKLLQVGVEGGFTSGSTSVYNGGTAVAATRRLAVETTSEFGYVELTYEAPEEARQSYAATYAHYLHQRMAKGKFSSLLYPDEGVFWARAAISGNPTVTTLPTAPTSLLAATNVLATNTLTTQPNAAGDGALAKVLAMTLSNASPTATAVVFTISGTDINNNALSEQSNFSAGTTTPSKVGGGAGATSCTLYTTNYFKTVTGITSSAQPSGDQLAVAGVNAFKWVFTPDIATSTLDSLTGEFFDGSTNWQLPGTLCTKQTFTAQIGKSLKVSGDTLSKDMTSISNLTSINDQVLPACSSLYAQYYSDPIGAVPGTTAVPARLIDVTFDIDNQLTVGKAADGTPLPTFVGRKKYKTKAEVTMLFINGLANSEDPSDFAAFARTYASRTIMVAFPAQSYLPCGQLTGSGNWPTQLLDATSKAGLYGVTIAHAGKWTAAAPADIDGRTAVKLTHEMEVDLTTMGAPYQVQFVNRMNPNM